MEMTAERAMSLTTEKRTVSVPSVRLREATEFMTFQPRYEGSRGGVRVGRRRRARSEPKIGTKRGLRLCGAEPAGAS